MHQKAALTRIILEIVAEYPRLLPYVLDKLPSPLLSKMQVGVLWGICETMTAGMDGLSNPRREWRTTTHRHMVRLEVENLLLIKWRREPRLLRLEMDRCCVPTLPARRFGLFFPAANCVLFPSLCTSGLASQTLIELARWAKRLCCGRR